MSKIKILFVHSKLVCGGAEQALFDLISLLDKTKFDVTVFVQNDGFIWERKFRDAGIRVESPWTCQKKSKNPLIKVSNFIKRNRVNKAIAREGEGLIKTCLGEEFDIIVSYHVWDKEEIAFSDNAKTVKYVHVDLETNQAFQQSALRTNNKLKQFDKVICVSQKAKTSFENVTGITETVVARFNPLNSDSIRKMAERGMDYAYEEKTICAVGRLAPEKGFERLIRLHKKLYDEGLKHRLIIVGDGPMRELLENVIRSIHCENSVTLAGYTNNPYPYIKNSEFMVCSSYTEALPVTAMEALSLGIPVVSAVPSIEEVFGGETCGVITENDDAGLENGIRRMLTDSVLYESVKAGAERRSQYFDGKRMVREIENEFINLVNS